MIKNAYIHIPFCNGGKCKYCSFISYPNLNLKDEYLNALTTQINTEYKDDKLNTLYLGGGTPSLLKICELEKLINLFVLENNAEITVEINPETIDKQYFTELKAIGVNRLSIGAQTFNDSILKIIGRKHSAEQINIAVNLAKEAGFDNISLDFIYGLPQQTMEELVNDLNNAIELEIQHISLYGLKIEKGCNFYDNMPENLPNLDIQADMYLKAVDLLENNGFIHYEISNFSKQGFESNHNLNYWNNNNYYGFGCSASGYIEKTRYQMKCELEKYIANPLKRDFEQELSEQEILEEEIFLGLRKAEGISISNINQKFGIDFYIKYKNIIDKYSKYFVKTKNGFTFNTNGFLISNDILAEFIS